MGSRAILDAVVKKKIPSSRRESNPRNPIVQPVAQRYSYWAITAHKVVPEINLVPRHEDVWGSGHAPAFYPGERAPDTHWIGGWVGPKARVDAVARINIPNPSQDSNPGPLASSLTELPRLLVPRTLFNINLYL
jgi:hypothetical protein